MTLRLSRKTEHGLCCLPRGKIWEGGGGPRGYQRFSLRCLSDVQMVIR